MPEDFEGDPRLFTVEDVRRLHVDRYKWADVGYHWLLRYPSDGAPIELYAGRPESVVGAHARGDNGASVGVAIVWNASEVAPPPELLEALAWHVAGVLRRYGLGTAALRAHRDLVATECPGALLNMDALRERVAQLLPTTLSAPELYG